MTKHVCARSRIRVLTLAMAAALAALAATAAAPARAATSGALTQLAGDAGCLKGTAGHSWIKCAPTVFGQYDVSSVAVSPDGEFAYGVSMYSGYTKTSDGKVVDTPGGTIVAFRRNAATGALTELTGSAACIRDVTAPINGVTRPCTVAANGLRGAKTITLSPDGRFAYVAAMESSAIAAFARDAETGALTQLPGAAGCVKDVRASQTNCGTATPGLGGVRWVTLSPDGRSLYASAPTSDDIVAFSRDTTSGALTPLPGADSCIEDKLARVKKCPTTGIGLNYPRSLTVSPDGRNVYVASDQADKSFAGDAADGSAVSVFARDTTTGALHQLPGADACIEDVHAPSTTACPRVGQGLLTAFEVVVTSDGRFAYVASSSGGTVGIFTRDTQTGALTQASGSAACMGAYGCTPAAGIKGANGITLSDDDRFAYVSGFDGRAVAAFARDATSGRLTQLAGTASCTRDVSASDTLSHCPVTINGLNGPRKLTLSPDGKSAYVPSSSGGTIAVFSVAP
jgi:6-phosphogluconolactonase (cycloisomerase 2 family)